MPSGVKMRNKCLAFAALSTLFPVTLFAQATAPITPSPLTISDLRAATAGNWRGELEYLDYGANQWFGIPMTVAIESQIDKVTTIRKADFDDGPVTGMVRITTISIVNNSEGKESSAIFRKNRPMDADVWQVRLTASARDLSHWTIIAETIGKDGNSQAKLRETTTRDGDVLTTLKEVDPLDDGKEEYFSRNRTRLTKVP
jgi:hypothetical protein